MVFSSLIFVLSTVHGLSLCGVITKACLRVVPAGGVSGFFGCTGASVGIAVACEIAGGGPEEPLSDLCAIGMGAKFEAACIAAWWEGTAFSAAACVNAMLCAWHPDEPKRPDGPKPGPPGPPSNPNCLCNPLTNQCGPDEDHCGLLDQHPCNPANGHNECESFRRADEDESFEAKVVAPVEEAASSAPPRKSPVIGGKKSHPRPLHHGPPKTCDDDVEEEIFVRPDELKDADDIRRRFVVGGRHCYCDEWCTYFWDCCPDCFHDHHTSDPCTDQYGQCAYGEAYCNNPDHCGEPAICGGCSYDRCQDHCYTPEVGQDGDTCTNQHGPAGGAYCNSQQYCGAPGFCQFCAYDLGSNHCYTPSETTPSCTNHWLCWNSLSNCESHQHKDSCLYEKLLLGNIGSCGQCLNENYGLYDTRAELESDPDSHEAYCLMWDCAEEFYSCYQSFRTKFPSDHHNDSEDTKATIFQCAQTQANNFGDQLCQACLAKYSS